MTIKDLIDKYDGLIREVKLLVDGEVKDCIELNKPTKVCNLYFFFEDYYDVEVDGFYINNNTLVIYCDIFTFMNIEHGGQ